MACKFHVTVFAIIVLCQVIPSFSSPLFDTISNAVHTLASGLGNILKHGFCDKQNNTKTNSSDDEVAKERWLFKDPYNLYCIPRKLISIPKTLLEFIIHMLPWTGNKHCNDSNQNSTSQQDGNNSCTTEVKNRLRDVVLLDD